MSADTTGTLADAVATVRGAQTVGLGGMMLYRRPVAACQALADASAVLHTVVTFSAGYETELLVEAGAISVLRTCYTGLEVFGPAPRIRRAVEHRELQLVDETELTLAAGLQAAALQLPWLPSAEGVLDTQYVDVRPDLVPFDDPISGRRLLALPTIPLDVSILHAPFADRRGNVVFAASAALDREMAMASRHVIVTVEQIVSDVDEVRAEHGEADLLEFQVDLVIEAPGGARPTSCHPCYAYDGDELLDHLERADV